MNTLEYYKKTGAKFTGGDEEFRLVYSNCDKQHAWTDEEGRFDSFLCMKDYRECDFNCNKHHPELNPDIQDFYNNCLNFEKR